MLRRLDIHNFKGFKRFTVHFKQQSFLVGPNNAGKSTLIAAVRTGAAALRIARSRSAQDSGTVDDITRRGHLIAADRLGLVDENLRHEFHPGETRLVFSFSDKVKLEILWEPDDGAGSVAAFCTLLRDGVVLSTPKQVREAFPDIGVIPVLSPLELNELQLSTDHLKYNTERRLVSQHLRNHLALLKGQEPDSDEFADQLEEFKAFAAPWIVELELEELKSHRDAEGKTSLDFYYLEKGGRHRKEIFWAGDGMQIWVQLLLHLYRLRHADLIVLDEPDLFLHADMQRRLVALLDDVPSQVITATHSPEVLGEARPDSVLWVSRYRKRAERAPSADLMSQLTNALGTQFNLRLARALRAKVVVFVEGDDTKILREIARTASAEFVADERDIVTIPLKGFDKWHGVEAFGWLINDFLSKSVETWVILDRDYRSDERVSKIEAELKTAGVNPHIWKRHEIENYLVCPSALRRLTDLDEGKIDALIEKAANDLRDDILAGLTREIMRGPEKEKDVGKASVAAQARLQAAWGSSDGRRYLVPGKELLAGVRSGLQDAGGPSFTNRAIAKEMAIHEIPVEMKELLRNINSMAR